MTLPSNVVLAAVLAYAALLFVVAAWADWQARRGRLGWLNSPWIYTLSLSVYCTSWTFYGAVGSAARSGLEFLTIYLGPTLVFIGWWAAPRRLVRLGRARNVTSIADFLSSRFGKDPLVAALATLLAVVAVIPYIALQLKAVASSFNVITAGVEAAETDGTAVYRAAFWLAVGLAGFTILFGTRSLASNERRHGVIAAIALEAVVKLLALSAIGLFVVFGISGGPSQALAEITPTLSRAADAFDARWALLTFLSAAAIVCLPRQFQVMVVDCDDPRHGRTASWAFPLYLFLMSLFILPIAAVGLRIWPEGGNEDLFVLSLPLRFEQPELALFVFIGGFSSATSMAIVSCIALSTMISNHWIAPIALGPRARADRDFRGFLLNARRLSIAAIMLLGFIYYRASGGSGALATIGLISFAGVAQFLPSLLAALYWPRASTLGARAGLTIGFALWFMLVFAPSLGGGLTTGGDDDFLRAVLLSLGANALALIGFSLAARASPLDRIQGALFTADDPTPDAGGRAAAPTADASSFYDLAHRILGAERAEAHFDEERRRQGLSGGLPRADEAFIARLEGRLAASIGAASAHAMVSQLAGGAVGLRDLMRIADENARMVAHSQALEKTSRELEEAARQLTAANERLREIDAQKDQFLSSVSHELRTPMTALRAFSDILRSDADLAPERRRAFLDVIHAESERLTRLLDQILDVGQLESGKVNLALEDVDPERALDRALDATLAIFDKRGARVRRKAAPASVLVRADPDRLHQVLLNVLSNALKHNHAASPVIELRSGVLDDRHAVWIDDNGPGVPDAARARLFSRFGRADGSADVQGVGLGLYICREIMAAHGGAIALDQSSLGGACFKIETPLAAPRRSSAADAGAEEVGAT